ncbi:MAG TPA: hydroxyphenylacetyl-CoA thioesterase PaaI [Steroidobacteraceae bacterium]|jgi:acyl-CoA thioesterase
MAGTTDAAQEIAERASRAMFSRDRAAQLLGMRVTRIAPGRAEVVMQVLPQMINGHHVCHGGLVFSLADTAFAYACNSYNDSTVAAAGSIDFLAPARAGDELTAVASELWRTRRNGLYEITVTNQHGERIALFRGRSHRISGQVDASEGA